MATIKDNNLLGKLGKFNGNILPVESNLSNLLYTEEESKKQLKKLINSVFPKDQKEIEVGKLNNLEKKLFTLFKEKSNQANNIIKKVIGKDLEDMQNDIDFKEKLKGKQNRKKRKTISSLERQARFYYQLMWNNLEFRYPTIRTTEECLLIPGYKIVKLENKNKYKIITSASFIVLES